jgi:hypothetical protein
MRGDDRQQGAMFSYVSAEQRVPAGHPLRPVRQMVDEVLQELSPRFDRMYAQMGRPSIALVPCEESECAAVPNVGRCVSIG